MISTNGRMVHRTALVLVVIDVQERLAAAMERADDVVASISRLVRLAEVVTAPVVVTRQYPEGLGDTVPALESVIAGVADAVPLARVDKTSFCACGEPSFLDALQATGRDQVVLTGMETHVCVAQTALDLQARGHTVFVVADACCSRRAADHDVALERLRAEGVIVLSSESVIYETLGRAGTDEFRRMLAVVKGA